MLAAALSSVACGGADDGVASQEGEARSSFNRDMVLLDEQLEDPHAMDVEMIQAFLTASPYGKASVLSEHVTPSGKMAAEVIHDAALTHGINPIVLLARVQLEMSLVSQTAASTRRLDWAMGCGCPDDGDCIEAFRGFDQQIDCAAERHRTYLNQLDENGVTQSGWRVGTPKTTSDGETVTPRTRATAALYTYTPWVDAQRKHRSIWNKYVRALSYVTPSPGGCGVAFFDMVTVQLRPDAELSARFVEAGFDDPACFIDSNLLIDPETLAPHKPNVKLSPHFRMNEFSTRSSSTSMLLERELVDTLERTRHELGAAITISVGFQDPGLLACVDACGALERDLRQGMGVIVDSKASHEALRQAAKRAGAMSCYDAGDGLFVGAGDPGVGCPADG